MLDIVHRNPVAFFVAALLHLLLLTLLMVGVDWREKPRPLTSDAKVVQARVINERRVQEEMKRRKVQAERKRRQVELKKRREAEKKRKAREAQHKAEAEKKRKASEAQRKAAAEKKRKASEAQRKAEAEKKRKASEAQRKAEAEKKRKAREAQRKAEAEKKRKAEEARRKAEADARERELQAQFEAEQSAREAAHIVRLIQDKVARNWKQPPGTLDKGLKCKVSVRLGPSGSVLTFSVVESSGNPAFDHSVETAVWKSRSLPMPDDPALRSRNEFRSHTFIFDPSRNP